MVTCQALRILLYGDGGGGVVLRRPSLWIVVQGVEGDGVVMFAAGDRQEGVEAVPGVPRWAWIGCSCRLQEGVVGALPSVLPEKVVFWAPLVVAPLHLPPPLDGRVGRWQSYSTLNNAIASLTITPLHHMQHRHITSNTIARCITYSTVTIGNTSNTSPIAPPAASSPSAPRTASLPSRSRAAPTPLTSPAGPSPDTSPTAPSPSASPAAP